MSVTKFGPWEKVSFSLKGIGLRGQKLRDYILDESSRDFQKLAQSEILTAKVEPENKDFTAQEYSERIKVDRKPRSVFIGLFRGEMIRGKDMGEWALEAEFGLHGAQFMGLWRKLMLRFNKEFKDRMDTINAGAD